MNFGEILSKAWKIIWKHKVLWVFGLLASCGAGTSAGGSGSSSGSFGGSPGGDSMRNAPPWLQNFFYSLERGFENGTIWIYIAIFVVFLIVLSLVLSVIFLLLRTVGKSALVRGAWQADAGREELTFKYLFNESKQYFWRVLLFSVILSVLGLLAGFILILPFLLTVIFTLGCGLLCLIPLFIAISWFIQALVELTIVAIVGEDLDIVAGVERAWKLLTENLGAVVLVTLILYIGQMVIATVTLLPFLVVIVPAVIGILAQTRTALTTGLLLSGVGLLFYTVLAVIVNSLVQAYLGTTWTLVFRRLTGREEDMLLPVPAPESALAEPLPDEPEEGSVL